MTDTLPTSDNAGKDFIARRLLNRSPVKKDEMQRICSLPIAEPLDPDELDAVRKIHTKPEAPEDFELTEGQASAMFWFGQKGGLFAPLPVGAGKTLIALRCVGIAYENGMDRIVLFVPPQVYSQLIQRDIGWARARVPLGCTFYKMGGLTPIRRRGLAGGGRRGCWIIPYSQLSCKDSFEILKMIRPELIVFDEAHALKNRRSARTKRVLTYFKEFRPNCVALSGTMTSKSLNDYAHILMMCLGQGSPVPMDANTIQEWAAVIDSEQNQTVDFHKKSTGTGPLRPLVAWSNAHFPETKLLYEPPGFRAAFQNRLITTEGVVTMQGEEVGSSLIFENVKADKMKHDGGARLLELQKKLEEEWVTPQGDEIEHAMLVWKWNAELSGGIYNSLVWPEVGELVEKQGISLSAAEHLLKSSQEHHEATQAYHRDLRAWFTATSHRPGLDTPMLVGRSMAVNGSKEVGEKLYRSWLEKEERDFNGRLRRDSIPVRVCDYKIQEALKWAKEQSDGGIVWFSNREVGRWAYEIFQAAGLPCIFAPSGKTADDFLNSPEAAENCKGKFLIASVKAHGTGKNLQFLANQFYIQLPATETNAEQAVGRTHRKGQQADEVVITTCISSTFDEMSLAALLNDAIYVYETTGLPRKLLVAAWNPMPIIYGSNILIRAGAQAKMLNARQQQLLRDRFNNDNKTNQ